MKFCSHEVLKFDNLGHAMVCESCGKRYLPMVDDGYVIDFNHYVFGNGGQIRKSLTAAKPRK